MFTILEGMMLDAVCDPLQSPQIPPYTNFK